ncbi:MAG: sigma-70 family RNA polymerase sigma factor [Sphingomonadales bacterium]|nr:sigma-70 family RNA polymerase sigma factor [Sphingomonadales bacterium]
MQSNAELASTEHRVTDLESDLRRLMIAGLAGDRNAYRKLLAAAADRLRQYYWRRLGREAVEAEDLVQETLMAIHSKRESYDRSMPFTAWLHAIARYKLVDHYRRMKIKYSAAINDVDEMIGADWLGDSLAALDVEELLCELSDKHRAAISLTKIEGYSVAEAAQISGQSESAIKVGVHRGMKRLAEIVEGYKRNEDR